MLLYNKAKQKCTILFSILIFAGISGHTQTVKIIPPVWWFGVSGAANFNFYDGTTQMLNNNLTVPTAFHKGSGIEPYVSVLTEYRPNKTWGGMLNIAYDNRGGKFDQVEAPCNCAADLSTNISYVTIEPSLRLAPFGSAFYIFAGPTISFTVANSFTYTQQLQPTTKSDWSDTRSTVFSAQAGAGIDIPISSPTSIHQTTLSPFVSFLTNLGQQPRSSESWSLYTVRAGVALKFGKGKKIIVAAPVYQPVTTVAPTAANTYITSPQPPTTCVAVKETYIPEDIITKVCNKYGPNTYDITSIIGTNGQVQYVIRRTEDGVVKTDWVSF
jgi:outer membrane protein with beta-barrel domain